MAIQITDLNLQAVIRTLGINNNRIVEEVALFMGQVDHRRAQVNDIALLQVTSSQIQIPQMKPVIIMLGLHLLTGQVANLTELPTAYLLSCKLAIIVSLRGARACVNAPPISVLSTTGQQHTFPIHQLINAYKLHIGTQGQNIGGVTFNALCACFADAIVLYRKRHDIRLVQTQVMGRDGQNVVFQTDDLDYIKFPQAIYLRALTNPQSQALAQFLVSLRRVTGVDSMSVWQQINNSTFHTDENIYSSVMCASGADVA